MNRVPKACPAGHRHHSAPPTHGSKSLMMVTQTSTLITTLIEFVVFVSYS